MAIIKCPECQQDVSDSALKCPSCGVQLRKPKRGFFGKLIKWSFILFNILMIVWLVTGLNNASKGFNELSEAGQTGAAIGTGLGVTLILILWAIGTVILGMLVLFTRPKS